MSIIVSSMLASFLFTLSILIMGSALVSLAKRIDTYYAPVTFSQNVRRYAASFLFFSMVSFEGASGKASILISAIFFGILFAAMWLDASTTKIPNWLLLMMNVSGIVCYAVWFYQTGWSALALESVIALTIFQLCNLFLFGRTFGSADAATFSAIAFFLTGRGLTLVSVYSVMVTAYLFLIVSQALVRKNFDRKTWRLKTPVAFIPYIGEAFAFWMFLCRVLPLMTNGTF